MTSPATGPIQYRAGLRLAVSTLTVLPVPAGRIDRGAGAGAMIWAPVVGLGLGGAAAGVAWCLGRAGLDSLPTAVALVVVLALLTRGLHLDGLADTVDALASYAGRERALAIMKSPEVGPLGAAAIGAVLLADTAALSSLVARSAWWSIALGVAAGRFIVQLCCLRGVPAARPDGLGALVADTVPRPWCVASVGWLIAVSVVLNPGQWWRPVLAVAVVTAVSLLALRHVVRRLGGVTGDVLGAGCEVGTAIALLVLSSH